MTTSSSVTNSSTKTTSLISTSPDKALKTVTVAKVSTPYLTLILKKHPATTKVLYETASHSANDYPAAASA